MDMGLVVRSVDDKSVEDQVSNPDKDLREEIAELKRKLAEDKSCNVTKCEENSTEMTYLVRFANVLINTFDLNDETNRYGVDVNAKIHLSKAQIKILRDFAAKRGNLADFDYVFSNFIAYTFPEKYEVPNFVPELDEDAAFRMTVACFVVAWLFLYFNGRYWTMFNSMFLLSCFWHWWHLYKQAKSDKHATLSKTTSIPKECSPESMTWTELFVDSFSKSDKCKDYHDALLVNPLVEVSPTMAIAHALSSFVFLPLEHLGKHLGKFFTGLTDQLSWVMLPFVLAFVFFLVVFIVIMMFKYRIDLPFWLGSIGPSNTTQHQLEVRKLQFELQQLKLELEKSAKKQQPALEIHSEKVEEITLTKETQAEKDPTVAPLALDLSVKARLENVGTEEPDVKGDAPPSSRASTEESEASFEVIDTNCDPE